MFWANYEKKWGQCIDIQDPSDPVKGISVRVRWVDYAHRVFIKYHHICNTLSRKPHFSVKKGIVRCLQHRTKIISGDPETLDKYK